MGRRVALGLLSIWLGCSGLSACTGSNPRDQRYGQDAGADFDAPAATGGAGGAGTGGTAGSGVGGTAAAGGAGGDATSGGNGGAAGNGGNGAPTGQAGAAGGNGGTAGQAGASGGNGGNGGSGMLTSTAGAHAPATFQNDWTAGPRATKMLLVQVS